MVVIMLACIAMNSGCSWWCPRAFSRSRTPGACAARGGRPEHLVPVPEREDGRVPQDPLFDPAVENVVGFIGGGRWQSSNTGSFFVTLADRRTRPGGEGPHPAARADRQGARRGALSQRWPGRAPGRPRQQRAVRIHPAQRRPDPAPRMGAEGRGGDAQSCRSWWTSTATPRTRACRPAW